MQIKNITVRNFRLLKDTSINLEETLSLIIGKNNTGKTSLLTVLERFLSTNQNVFSFDDFSVKAKEGFKNTYEENDIDTDFEFSLSLSLTIEYTRSDNLKNLSDLMVSLESGDNLVLIEFVYLIDYERAEILRRDFDKHKENYPEQHKDILDYLKLNHKKYFKIEARTINTSDPTDVKVIEDKSLIKKLINFNKISAKRDVINQDGSQDTHSKTLSKQSSKYYELITKADEEIDSVVDLQNQLSIVDEQLDENFKQVFGNVIEKVGRFGGITEGETSIVIKSMLQGKDILKENTSVTYTHGDHTLPEDFNGLGYLNLISMIFEIEVIINDFKKTNINHQEPSSINLLFIEEPEAHTHPQMQYIFIKNIKELLEEECLDESGEKLIDLQTVITTHSSHITAESNFKDIKYFSRESMDEVVSKDVKLLEDQYDNSTNQYKFLRKYLTLNSAELFFADKAILIEGDTERILLPSIMKKMDLTEEYDDLLTSQNISIIESGAYSKIFEKFLQFLDIKTLILTDLDSVKENDEGKKIKCRTSEGEETSNSAIKHFLDPDDFKLLLGLEIGDKVLGYQENQWTPSEQGNLFIAYQTEENSYTARSFEDSFINLNLDYVKNNKDDFMGLKNRDLFDTETDPYILADKCISKKTNFALDIIYNSDDKFSEWSVPEYIREGLEWLMK